MMYKVQYISLPSGGPFTLFAPVDAAFDKFAGKAIGKKEAIQIVNKHLVRTLLQIRLENSGNESFSPTLT